MATNETMSKKKKVHLFTMDLVLVAVGCLFVALGAGLFIEPAGLVVGGVTSIALLINKAIQPLIGFDCVDILVWIIQLICWLVGFLVLGKKFALNTLMAAILYPLFNTLIYRLVTPNIGLDVLTSNTGDPASMMLVAIFGGLLVGSGVAISYYGNGSTGGVDVFVSIIGKYTAIKESVASFIIDGSLVLVGMLVFGNIINGLIGIMCAMVCAIAIKFIYVEGHSHVIFEIISENFDPIKEYVEHTMDHATTIIDVTGGYTGTPRKMLRCVVYYRETEELKRAIAQFDPHAFVVITTANAIKGEGFDPLTYSTRDKRNKKNG